MVWVGFWACGFGMGQARAAGNFRTAFGPHLGRIWAAFGPPLYVNNVNKTKKCNYWNSKYNLLKIYVKFVNNLVRRLNFSKLWG